MLLIDSDEDRSNPNSPQKETFTGETIQAISDLGDVLESVHRRLLAQGYIIKDNVYVPPSTQKR